MRSFEKDLISLVSFLISSARGLLKEPKIYGSFRLIDAASRLISILQEMGISNDDLRRIKEEIEERKYSLMYDQSEFVKLLEDLSGMVGEMIKKIES